MNPALGSKTAALRVKQNTILLVDDDPAVREMIGRVLVGEGYLVLSAASGVDALAIAAAHHVDIAMLDLNMPMQSGWETFEQLVAHDPDIAVIIITGRSNQLFTALGAGVGALFEKPLDFPALLQTVKALLKESSEHGPGHVVEDRAEFHYLPSTGKQHSP